MGRSAIKLPDDCCEMSYDQRESDGSGTDQLEVLKWVGISAASVAVAGGMFVGVHRLVQGYWIWNRTVANMDPVERGAFLKLNPQQKKNYLFCMEQNKKYTQVHGTVKSVGGYVPGQPGMLGEGYGRKAID